MSESFESLPDEVTEEESLQEESTIFSAPEEKHDKAEKPKLLKKIIIGAAALLVLVGVIVGVVLLVEKVTDDESNTSIQEYFILNGYTSVSESTGEELFDYDAISKVDLKSQELTLNMYSKLGEDEDTLTVWLESSMPEEYTSETSVASVVKALLGMKYTRIISDTVKEGVDYGFEKPLYTAEVTPYEGESFTVKVGKQSADQSGYYVTVSNDGKVYLVKNSYITSLKVKDKMELTKALTISGFEESEGSAEYYASGSLSTFDYVYLKNASLGEKYKFVTVTDKKGQGYNTFDIVEPITRPANDAGVATIVDFFANGVSSSGLYCLTKTDTDLKKYSLDKPDLEVSMKAGEQQRTILARLQEDGDYAVVTEDFDVILRVSVDQLTVLDISKKDIYFELLFIETLSEVDKLTVKGDSSENSFTVKTGTDDEGETIITGVSINDGEVTNPEEFQSYYSFLLGIKALSYDTSDLSGKKPKATVTIKKNDKSTTVIEYYEAQNGRYQVVVNGTQMGLIGSSNVKNVIKYASNVAAGKVYNS